MRILLDTHIILWAMNGNNELSGIARDLISDPSNDVFYSIASVWEVTIKHIAHPDKMLITGAQFSENCKKMGFAKLSIREEHILLLDQLRRSENSKPHNDPFDRLLICQAKAEGLRFMTHDSLIPDYNEECVLSV
ncbi:MAG: type II toxin-antitoxin system VapC family toxin [Oscillospiraceae bacterium]|nr:type II toxin-antitoxin system VapC family toxin [Oscillospiraceae bacterium]